MKYQNEVQDENTLLFGSGTLYIATTEVALATPDSTAINLGALDNVKFTETISYVTEPAHNAKLPYRVKEQTCEVSADMLEFNTDKLNTMRGGIDTYTETTGSTTSATITVASTAYDFNDFIPFTIQSYDETVPTSITVTAATAGVLVADDDYYVSQSTATNQWGIVIVDGTKLTSKENLSIAYTYKYASKRTLSSGGKSAMTPIFLLIRNEDEGAEKVDLIVYEATYSGGIDMSYQSDTGADKPNATPIKFTGRCVGTRTIGDQLFRIDDYRLYTE